MVGGPLSGGRLRSTLRESLFSAMDELVRRDGWAATSIAKLAIHTGVSRQTIYNEFGTRDGIAQTYLLHRIDVMLDAAEAAVLANCDNVEVGLRAGLEIVFDQFDQPLVQTALANGGIGSEELVPLARATNAHATARVANLLLELQPDLVEPATTTFADALARVALTHALVPTHDRDEAIDRLVRVAIVFLGGPR
ncbi:TetR/AcrR family transcriptional regulator [Nocardioides immobilis]|uniref:TetR/AcrR family transcriptional regulator n=1 Tax=Nocardioides immobilis TaxID=2049295 RepID=UPI0015FC8081|nr:TetR/AcrR family transcriptional regulator [Nocardioides immobilis]